MCEKRSLLWVSIYLSLREWERCGEPGEAHSTLVRPRLPPLLPHGPSNPHLALVALLSCCVFEWECNWGPDGDCYHSDRSEWQQAGVHPGGLSGICHGRCSSRYVQRPGAEYPERYWDSLDLKVLGLAFGVRLFIWTELLWMLVCVCALCTCNTLPAETCIR